MYTMKDFVAVTQETCDLLDDIAAIESRKITMISAKDVDALDALMKEEQVLLLRFRGLDQKREACQTALGCPQKTLKQIAEADRTEWQTPLLTLYETISEKLKSLKSLTDSTKKYIDLHLRSLDHLIATLETKPSDGSYTKEGQKKPRPIKKKFNETKV